MQACTPEGVAVDGSGDVFIADTVNSRVVVDKPNGSGGYTQSVVDDTGLSFPEGVAVDGSGDVFIADTGNNRVVVDKPNGSGGYTQSVVAQRPVRPGGGGGRRVGGRVHRRPGNGRVVVDKPNGSGGYTQSVVDDTGLCSPAGVAVDGSGDVFIADTGSNRVVVDKPNGSGGYTQSVVDDTGLSYPPGVAVDASGDVFIADTDRNRVVVDKPNGSGGYTQSVVRHRPVRPVGVAVDGAGDVFIADTGNESGGGALDDSPDGGVHQRSDPGFVDGRVHGHVDRGEPGDDHRVVMELRGRQPGRPARRTHHTYGSTGNYTVSLTVTDSKGQTSTVTQRVVVARCMRR